jgi:adenylate cyclase
MFNLTTKDILNLRKNAREIEGSIRIKTSPQIFWNYIINNELIAQKAGKPPTTFSYAPDYKGLFLLYGEWKLMGMKMVYYELPYEWNNEEDINGELIYTNGPFTYLVMNMSFKKTEDNQDIFVFKVRYFPRFPVISDIIAKQFFKLNFKVYQDLDSNITANEKINSEAFFQDNEEIRTKAKSLEIKWKYIKPDSLIPEKLAFYIYSAPDQFISKIRPFEIANNFKLDPLDVLIFCLSATRAGFLDLSWDILCPGCKGTSFKASKLNEIESEEHCDSCKIRFDVNFDKNVEITFSPHENIRKIINEHFCLGSPSNTPHTYAQFNLEPESNRVIKMNFPPGRYRLRSLTMKGEIYFEVQRESGQKNLAIELKDEFPLVNNLQLAVQTVFNFSNPGENWVTIKIDNLFYLDYVTTAHFVTCLQDFRDSFGSQVLRPGIKMGISNLVVLFSDLKDSTLLYETKGDAEAFSVVQDHFEIMTNVIRKNNGGIVKTIGDAVMAVFSSAPDAIRASIGIMEEFNEWNTNDKSNHKIIVNLGLHEGPCLALNLNDKLDYFGSTVNKAARIQGTSKDGHLVLSESVYNNPEVKQIFQNFSNLSVDSFFANLKGIEGENMLYKIYFLNFQNKDNKDEKINNSPV